MRAELYRLLSLLFDQWAVALRFRADRLDATRSER